MSISADGQGRLIDFRTINNPPIYCVVSHTVSQPTTISMTPQHVIKMLCFLALSMCSIIGSIVACSTSHFVSPHIPQAPQGPVDGEWSPWKEWTPCSISCSSRDEPYGNTSRVRYCNSPPPQLGGKVCAGVSQERTECFKKACPIPVDGEWAEWSSWSQCSETCQSSGKIPTQSRYSSCTSPEPKDGGRQCEGESVNRRFCTWLVQCPVNGQWSAWFINGACESVNQKACALGKKLYKRQCNKPSPVSPGKACEGASERNLDCWFEIGCSSGLQPPLAVQTLGNGSGVFEIRWSSVPYGVAAVKYRLYLTMEGSSKFENATHYMNITAIPPEEISGRHYSITADMTRFLRYSTFEILVVRMSSFDYWDNESLLTDPIQSMVIAVDGQWGEWDHWSECSTQCTSKMGERNRIRICDRPTPSKGGKMCSGSSVAHASCIGMEHDC